MPAALDVNWGAVRALYITGATFEELADAFGISRGTISARASRDGWSRPQPRKEMQNSAAEATASLWQSRIAEAKDDWHTITSKVRGSLKGKDADFIISKADKVKAILEVERKNFGLDKETGNTVAVQFNLIGEEAEAETVEFESIGGPAVEADCEEIRD